MRPSKISQFEKLVLTAFRILAVADMNTASAFHRLFPAIKVSNVERAIKRLHKTRLIKPDPTLPNQWLLDFAHTATLVLEKAERILRRKNRGPSVEVYFYGRPTAAGKRRHRVTAKDSRHGRQGRFPIQGSTR